VLAAVAPELPDALVGLVRLLELRLALDRPLPLPAGAIEQRRAFVD
jgi:hypothetical protein